MQMCGNNELGDDQHDSRDYESGKKQKKECFFANKVEPGKCKCRHRGEENGQDRAYGGDEETV